MTVIRSWFRRSQRLVVLSAAVLLAACAGNRVQNADGVRTIDLDPSQRGPVAGIGIEGQDIVAMTDRMARDMIAAGFLNGLSTPPRIIVDDTEFKNDGSQPINKKMITDRLRVELNRASQGRMVFVGRQYSRSTEAERAMKDAGVVDVGTTGRTRATAGGDFKLGGTIATLDTRSNKSGLSQRYNQIIFELFDLETNIIVWNGMYEFARAAADDVIYR